MALDPNINTLEGQKFKELPGGEVAVRGCITGTITTSGLSIEVKVTTVTVGTGASGAVDFGTNTLTDITVGNLKKGSSRSEEGKSW